MCVFPARQGGRALAADGHSGPLLNTCFTLFWLLGHQKIVFSRVWGVMAPTGKVVA